MSEKNLDYKKEFKDLYLPPGNPVLVTVPAMQTGPPRGQSQV